MRTYFIVVCLALLASSYGTGRLMEQVSAHTENYGQMRDAELGCITDSECELGPLRGYNQYNVRDSGPSQEYDYSTIPDPQLGE